MYFSPAADACCSLVMIRGHPISRQGVSSAASDVYKGEVDALEWAAGIDDGPCAIVAHTVKGKGVSFMENNPSFHGKAPTDDEFVIAMEELR